jgi:AraC family transcriptional regulator of adaptative response/methylated-DNA-[protein]-cysteine methyltransferase
MATFQRTLKDDFHGGASQEADDDRWNAIVRRDPARDGEFVFGVRTTGVYCRPSCPARRPRRENVRVFASGSDARAHGFRACKRCDPDGVSAWVSMSAVVEAVCREIEASPRTPRLADLAKRASISPSRLHQIFREIVGVTPWEYGAVIRAERLRTNLAMSKGVVESAFDAGHGSVSNAYIDSIRHFGMSPARYRDGARGEVIAVATVPCTLGLVGVAISEVGVCAVALGESTGAVRTELTGRFPNATLVEATDLHASVLTGVVDAIERPRDRSVLPLDIRGTAFQVRVWRAISQIALGSKMTYKDVARLVGKPNAARAVGQACMANPLAVVVPCHRVVPSDGSLGGYRWGPQRKADLLTRE